MSDSPAPRAEEPPSDDVDDEPDDRHHQHGDGGHFGRLPEALDGLVEDISGDGKQQYRVGQRSDDFTSPESAEAWIDGRPGLFHVSVDEAFELGRVTNRLRMRTIFDGSDGGER